MVSEEISSRSEFADRGTAAGRTAYLEYHGVAAGGVTVALTGGLGLRGTIEMRRRVGYLRPYLEPEATGGVGSDCESNTSWNEEKARVLDRGF